METPCHQADTVTIDKSTLLISYSLVTLKPLSLGKTRVVCKLCPEIAPPRLIRATGIPPRFYERRSHFVELFALSTFAHLPVVRVVRTYPFLFEVHLT